MYFILTTTVMYQTLRDSHIVTVWPVGETQLPQRLTVHVLGVGGGDLCPQLKLDQPRVVWREELQPQDERGSHREREGGRQRRLDIERV